MHDHAFVTIVFDAELELLRLQARSMALYAPADLVQEIVVIDNSARPLAAASVERLLADYGPLRPRVRVLRAAEVTTVPLTKGWRSQQVQKLAIADLLAAPRYVVLDAKTHLIFPLCRDFLEGADGRPTVNVYSYVDHPLRDVLCDVLRYLDVDPAPHIAQFTATVTPFVFDTALMREMMRWIEARSGRRFADEFVLRELTEFFLYSGWLLATGRKLEDVYRFHQRFCQIIWGHLYAVEDCVGAIDAARAAREPFFSVHRKAIAEFGDAQIALVAGFWHERGLFATARDADTFLRGFRDGFVRHRRFDRVRAVPAQVATVLRRGWLKVAARG